MIIENCTNCRFMILRSLNNGILAMECKKRPLTHCGNYDGGILLKPENCPGWKSVVFPFRFIHACRNPDA